MARIRYRFDEHVSHAVARGLRRRGIDVVTASESGAIAWPDQQLLARCLDEGRVLVTHDEDFVAFHHQGVPHAGIAYCKPNRRTIGELVAFLQLMVEVMADDDMRGRL